SEHISACWPFPWTDPCTDPMLTTHISMLALPVDCP
ncbi:unnamed protein product, partial [Brassica rapa subsp. trilocularis]